MIILQKIKQLLANKTTDMKPHPATMLSKKISKNKPILQSSNQALGKVTPVCFMYLP